MNLIEDSFSIALTELSFVNGQVFNGQPQGAQILQPQGQSGQICLIAGDKDAHVAAI